MNCPYSSGIYGTSKRDIEEKIKKIYGDGDECTRHV